MNKKEAHVVIGMVRDMSAAKFNPNFVFDARNIRITARGKLNSLLAVTNEKGTEEITVTGDALYGLVIGSAVFPDMVVLFTTETVGTVKKDRIYRLTFNANGSVASKNMTKQTGGTPDYLNLGFNAENPLETYPLYETSEIKKVYWVDGINQPRVINICDESVRSADSFNFVREVALNHTMTVTKNIGGGQFPAGEVQYCFAYFNKFGQQTPIIECSPMYYLSPSDRGLPADGNSNATFTIELTNLDSNFEYVRIYSIISTSENSVPNVRIVGDYAITMEDTVSYEELLPSDGGTIPDSGSTWGIGPIAKENLVVRNTATGELLYSIDDVYDALPVYTGLSDSKIFSMFTGYRIYNLDTQKYYLINREYDDDSGVVEEDASVEIAIVSRGDDYYVTYVPSLEYIDQFIAGIITSEGVKKVTISDNGTYGSSLDAAALHFIGGESFIPKTLAVKDNTIFFGNITHETRNIGQLKTSSGQTISEEARLCYVSSELFGNPNISKQGFYDYKFNTKNSSFNSKGFKSGENYRLGFIAQDTNGKWSEAVWLGDYFETSRPSSSTGGVVGTPSQKPGFSSIINKNIVDALLDNNYVRIAPVVVYPNSADRYVICQGILSGTVFNVGDRDNNSPFAQADWRFRPGYSWKIINDEIQLNSVNRWLKAGPAHGDPSTQYHDAPDLPATSEGLSYFVDYYNEYFYRDPSILTFHSPDVEFNDSALNSDYQNTKLRIVGYSSLNATTAAITKLSARLTAETPGYDDAASVLEDGFNKVRNDMSFTGYVDFPVKYDSTTGSWGGLSSSYYYMLKWRTYLWHRHGSLSNADNISTTTQGNAIVPIAKLGTKCVSEISYGITSYFNDANVVEVPIESIALWNRDSSLAKITYNGKEKNYYGNIDKVLSINPIDTKLVVYNNTAYLGDSSEAIKGLDKSEGYPIFADDDGPLTRPYRGGSSHAGATKSTILYAREESLSGDPVYMKYNSTRHLVLTSGNGLSINHLGEALYAQTEPDIVSDTRFMFWDADSATHATLRKLDNLTENNVAVAELYREFPEGAAQMRFGGTSKEALALNDWMVCGDAVVLPTDNTICTIDFKEGDCFFARYDCLKTYPVTQQDENSIVSIYSTNIESRVNLDLRYDKNRGLEDNTLVTPENFNLFNRPGYEQTNRYFTYHSLDYDKFSTTHFPNMVTWSLEKTLGEEIDTWTEMSMMSTFDMEGALGEITKLATFGNELFGFQQNGIAQVLYNSRVQIPTSDGQPIEITNGLKYGGLRYITKTVGLTNKWSMVESPLGLYFVDDAASTLYRFTGQLSDVSTAEGFNTWFSEVCSNTVWNPKDFGNIKSFYDRLNKDVYFVTKNTALVFSEQLGKFTSFMDYAKVTDMFSISNKYFAIRNTNTKIWQLWKGRYNSFFGEFKPFWLTFVSNDGQVTDKVYDTLEWRTQAYNSMSGNTSDNDMTEVLPFSTFDTLRVWNDHQDTLNTLLVDAKGKSYNLKKKFNVFRALVPRDKSSHFAAYNRDRIRNPWTFIQLSKELYNDDLLVFNDLVVNYFE